MADYVRQDVVKAAEQYIASYSSGAAPPALVAKPVQAPVNGDGYTVEQVQSAANAFILYNQHLKAPTDIPEPAPQPDVEAPSPIPGVQSVIRSLSLPTREEEIAALGSGGDITVEARAPRDLLGVPQKAGPLSGRDIIEGVEEQMFGSMHEKLDALQGVAYKFLDPATFGLVKLLLTKTQQEEMEGKIPDDVLSTIVGEAAHLAGFIKGGPMQIAKIGGKAAAKVLSKIVKDPKVLGWIMKTGGSAVQLGTATAISDITDIGDLRANLEQFTSGTIMGAVFAGSSLANFEKIPAISKIIRQVGGRALLNIAGMYEDPVSAFSNWDEMTQEERGQAVYDELINSYFLWRGASPKKVSAAIDIEGIFKANKARNKILEKEGAGYRLPETAKEINSFLTAYKEKTDPMREEGALEKRFGKTLVPQPPSFPKAMEGVEGLYQEQAKIPPMFTKGEEPAVVEPPKKRITVTNDTETGQVTVDVGDTEVVFQNKVGGAKEQPKLGFKAGEEDLEGYERTKHWKFIPKDQENWQRVMDVTNGKGIRPDKDPQNPGKWLDLNEFKENIPQPLRNYKTGLAMDDVVHHLKAEGYRLPDDTPDSLYGFLAEKRRVSSERERYAEKEEDFRLEQEMLNEPIKTPAEGDFEQGRLFIEDVKKETKKGKVAEGLMETFRTQEGMEDSVRKLTGLGYDVEFGPYSAEKFYVKPTAKKSAAKGKATHKSLFTGEMITAENLPSAQRGLDFEETGKLDFGKKEPSPESPWQTYGKETPTERFTRIETAKEAREEYERLAKESPVKGEEPAIGLQVEVSTAYPKAGPKERRLSDPKADASWRAGKKNLDIKAPLAVRVKDALIRFKHYATRVYPSVSEREAPEFYESTRQIANVQNATFDQAMRAKYKEIDSFRKDPYRYDLYGQKEFFEGWREEYEIARKAKRPASVPLEFPEAFVKSELAKIDAELKNYPELEKAGDLRKAHWRMVSQDNIDAWKAIGRDVSGRFKREHYIHHSVLEMENPESAVMRAWANRLQYPAKKGYERGRTGYKGLINTDYLEAEMNVLPQVMYDTKYAKYLKKMMDEYDIYERLRDEAKDKGLDTKTRAWIKELIPEGYVEYDMGKFYRPIEYLEYTSAQKMLDAVFEDAMEGEPSRAPGGPKKKTAVIIGKYRPWIVEKKMADAFERQWKTQEKPNEFVEQYQKVHRGLKKWLLLSPEKALKYNFRNQTGDLEGTIMANPRAMKHFMESFKILYDGVILGKDITDPKARDWIYERGGMRTTLQAQELNDIRTNKLFKELYAAAEKGDANVFEKVWKGYWRNIQKWSDFREAILRLANYKEYMDQMEDPKSGGKPKNFGASDPKVIMGLKDIRDRAARMANANIGSYDQVTALGQALRQNFLSFWSWKERNMAKNYQLLRNVFRDDPDKVRKLGGKWMDRVGFAAKKSLFVLYRAGLLAVKAHILWDGFMLLNKAVEELGLLSGAGGKSGYVPDSLQERPHFRLFESKEPLEGDVRDRLENHFFDEFTIVSDADAKKGVEPMLMEEAFGGALDKPELEEAGDIGYIPYLGAYSDLFDWVGGDPYGLAADLINGKISLKDAINEAISGPVNVLVQAVTPLAKAPIEAFILKEQVYPDYRDRRQIKSTAIHLLRTLGLDDEFSALAGKVGKPYDGTKALWNKMNLKEQAYHETIDDIREWAGKFGGVSGPGEKSPRSADLYAMRQALRFGNAKVAEKYYQKYAAWYQMQVDDPSIKRDQADADASVKRGVVSGLENLAPLAFAGSKANARGFLAQATKEQREKLLMAYYHYFDMVLDSERTAKEAGGKLKDAFNK
uniref:Putative methyltransferase n=1 Tax=viral metagenome TaxID=1070528 RepID=A0A6M3K9J5_9ZZZZ